MAYSIDINFLRDRKLDSQGGTTLLRKKRKQTPMSERIPVLIGSGVGIAFVAASGGALLILKEQKAQTEQAITQLDAEIKRLQGQSAEIKTIQVEIDKINQQTGDLVSVFSTIKPWSAILNEISKLVPSGVQLDSIAQGEEKSITITGTAATYDDVNDFVLVLQKSPLFNPEKTKLTNASLGENQSELVFDTEEAEQETAKSTPQAALNYVRQGVPTQNTSATEQAEALEAGPTVEFPKIITYNITTELSETPAPELIKTLNNNGAIGLVSRLRTLQKKGVIKQ
jgi:type IV pilus assembly protein PilN